MWHWHRWKVTGAANLYNVNLTYQEIKTPVTEVLFVCDCGAVQTRQLDGHWTLEQLRPALSEKEADKKFFRSLGVKL